jgi:hypothetical protein
MQSDDKLGVLLAGLLGLIALAMTAPVANGWALAKLWLWFVVPRFGLPILTLPQAIGLGLVASALLFHPTDCAEKERTMTEKVGRAIGLILARPALLLAVGWIVRQYA